MSKKHPTVGGFVSASDTTTDPSTSWSDEWEDGATDSDKETPDSDREAIENITDSLSSWGVDDPPDSVDDSYDTSLKPDWEKDTSFSQDSSFYSEDHEATDSSFLEDHLHVHPENDPVERKKVKKPKVSCSLGVNITVDEEMEAPLLRPFSVPMFLHGHHFQNDIRDDIKRSVLRIQK